MTREELCRQLIGAGTGFVGSVGGASVGSHTGTLILPGWGTFIGGIIGGNVGYSYGKEFGVKVIGEIFPAILNNAFKFMKSRALNLTIIVQLITTSCS